MLRLASHLVGNSKLGFALFKSGRERLDDSIKRLSPEIAQPGTILKDGIPGEEIVASAREGSADLIVIATHGRSGRSRFLMGSTAKSVLR